MKRDIFESYIREQLSARKSAQDVINEIEKLVDRYGQLTLQDEQEKDVIFESFWLKNIQYQETIKQLERMLNTKNR